MKKMEVEREKERERKSTERRIVGKERRKNRKNDIPEWKIYT